MRRRPSRLLALAVGAAAFAGATAAAAAVNVLQNPGAEADPSGQPVSGWTPGASGFQALVYGGSFPGTDVSTANGGGVNFFWAGNVASGSMSQAYTPTPAQIALIDAGRMQATLAADIGGWSSQDDAAEVTAVFRDSAGPASVNLGSGVVIGPVLAKDRGNQTTLLRRSANGAVPKGTRQIEVVVVATRTGGASNDGYADNVFLELNEFTPAPPPPAPDTRGIPNPTIRTDGSAVVVAPGQTTLRGCRRGQRKTINVRVQSSARGEVFVSIFSGVSSVRLFGSRWVTFGGPGSRRVGIRVPCPAKTADVRTVGLKSALAAVERGDRRGISTPQAKSGAGAVVIAPRVRPVSRLRNRPVIEVRVRSRKAGRVVARVTGRASGLRFSGQRTVAFAQEGVRLVRITVRLRGLGVRGNASVILARPRVLGLGGATATASEVAGLRGLHEQRAAATSVPPIDCAALESDPDVIRGTARGERIVGTSGDDKILAGAGNDTVRGLGGNDIICAGPGDDEINGGPGNDAMDGAGGRDRAIAGPGDDVVRTGPGNDRAFGGDGDDMMDTGGGNDRARGDAGNDTIDAGPGDDDLGGGGGSDMLRGRGGADQISSGAGGQLPGRGAGIGGDQIRGDSGADNIVLDSYYRSTVSGGPGNDIIAVRATLSGRRSVAASPIVRGGGGDDTISSGPSARGIYRFFGGSGDDEISGNNGVDIIDLGGGQDTTRGFGNDDVLQGGPGNDIIHGGTGRDTTNGGPGSDFCRTSERATGCEDLV